MTEKLVSPRLQRACDFSLRRAGQLVEDEAFHIIAVSEMLSPELREMWPKIAEVWEERGLGRVITEGDQDGQRSLWSFSESGLAEAARLIKLERQRSWRLWFQKNALTIVGVSAAVVAGIATSISAYIDYLELK